MTSKQLRLFDIEQVKSNFDQLYEELLEGIRVSKNQSEEKLKIETEKRIYHFLKGHGVDLSNISQYEEGSVGTIKINGRTDALYGSLILEFKRVGVLSQGAGLKAAINQVKNKYLKKLSDNKKKYFFGIIFDGTKFNSKRSMQRKVVFE